MRDIRIGTAQFEARDADPEYNLQQIRRLTRTAVDRGAEVVLFHECCISGYSYAQSLSKSELLAKAEPVPKGPSTEALIRIAQEFRVILLAGLFEREADRIYNTCVCVGPDGFLARHRKLHVFISPHLTPGSEFTVFEAAGCQCGILICYDNNLPENVRATALMGAEIVFMPHVTGCLPSVMPGRGIVDPSLWHNRERDPVRLRQEFEGPKGRGWLLRFLPARAWENGVYAVFSNFVGMDYGQVRNGNAMILDPFGEVMVESSELGDDVVVGLCTGEKIGQASGRRYLRARRPDLYSILVAPPAQPPLTEPGWTPGGSIR